LKPKPLYLRLIAAGVFLFPVIEGNSSLAETSSSVFRQSHDHTELNGIWRSRGYGWIWSIGNGEIRGYDATENYCTASSFALYDLAENFRISKTGKTIKLAFEDPTYQYTFDKIDALPVICSEARDNSAVSVFNALNELFATHYAFFESRNVDWAQLVNEARKHLTSRTSDSDLLKILGSLLSQIQDDHVSLIAYVGGREIIHNSGPGQTLKELSEKAQRSAIEFNVLIERWKSRIWTKDLIKTLFHNNGHEAAGGLIRYGFIDGDIGLLSIMAMEGFATTERGELKALDEVLNAAMKHFKDAKAVIVDVSINDGGYDSVARQVATRFTSKRTLAYSKYAGDAPGDQPQDIYIEPAGKLQFTGPVYLLTSDVTVSAAEIFVMCMRALPNVTHVGKTTRGSLSDALWKELPNKWVVSLSNEVYLDAEGKNWEGNGIPPHIKIDIYSEGDPSSGLVNAIRSIVAMIRTEKHK